MSLLKLSPWLARFIIAAVACLFALISFNACIKREAATAFGPIDAENASLRSANDNSIANWRNALLADPRGRRASPGQSSRGRFHVPIQFLGLGGPLVLFLIIAISLAAARS